MTCLGSTIVARHTFTARKLAFLHEVVLVVLLFSPAVATETWCGKNYQDGQPVVPPKGSFPSPVQLQTPEFAFRCLPRVQPYLESDDCSSASLLIDTLLTSVHLHDSLTLPPVFSLGSGSPSTSPKLTLTVELESQRASYSNVEFDLKGLELPLSLCNLRRRRESYSLKCVAEIELLDGSKYTYNYTSSLLYLPEPTSGSVTKLDRKTGALLARPERGVFAPIFPVGFYTDFKYLSSNLSVLDEIKSQRFNIIHPVPPFGDESALGKILDRLDEIGLYLVYDMRHSYQDLKSLERQVNLLKNHKSLLVWYTADEPDGPGDPLHATRAAYNLIQSLDGYHPVSIVLNCADHYFEEYASGADIIMPDVDFGCCGCDNCQGRLEDISDRLDDMQLRSRLLGWDSTKLLWTVPQAFGGEEFWNRSPTGREWLVQALLSINHGARGIMPWIDPTSQDIKEYASRFAKLLPQLTPYFFGDDVKLSRVKITHLDVATWRKGTTSLIIATNLDADWTSSDLRVDGESRLNWILREGVSLSISGHIVFQPLGCAIFLNSIGDEEPESSVAHDEL